MLLVGLTGGIASGKSLVAHVFSDLGAHIIDADLIVHDLLEPNQQTWCDIIHYFGRDILLSDQRIDRRKLGEIVFKNADKRAWLNSCLHPRVFEAFSTHVKHVRELQPDAIIVFDAALLIETGYYRKMDRTVVVYTEQEQQVERLSCRNGFSQEQAFDRIQSQMPLAEKLKYADYVVRNTGTKKRAENRAAAVFKKLKQQAERTIDGTHLS
jgi:dephospho-CoA kinase